MTAYWHAGSDAYASTSDGYRSGSYMESDRRAIFGNDIVVLALLEPAQARAFLLARLHPLRAEAHLVGGSPPPASRMNQCQQLPRSPAVLFAS